MNIEKYNVCYKPCAQRAHTHLLMYNFCWIIFPKFWQFISNKYFYFKNVHSPTLRRKGSQKPFNWHIFILIVGMIYPIQIYIFCNIYICIQICGIHVSCIYILVLDISYQQLGNVSVGEFLCTRECTFCNVCICIGYMLPTFGEYTSVEGFLCALRAQS